jgi:hypothetical protein
MFRSIDGMHYQWKNCLVTWNEQYLDKDGNMYIILEAITDQSLWIWHAFFGTAGSNNDINVLQRSPFVKKIQKIYGEYDDISFDVNSRRYSKYYLLADDIYPKWWTFVKSIKYPQGEKIKHFANKHEAARKDAERCFGVLKARWSILQQTSCL